MWERNIIVKVFIVNTTKKDNNEKKAKGRPQRFCRDNALKSAMAIFCEKGYEAASVANLGKAMGMNPPSLYNAFGDKEGLFIEVLELYHKPHEEIVRNIFRDEKNTQNAILELMNLSKNYHCVDNALGCLVVNSSINIHTGESSKIANKIKQLHDKNESMICKRLEDGQNNGDIPTDTDVAGIARYINGILLGAAVLARGQQSPQAVKDLIDMGYKGFLKLIT